MEENEDESLKYHSFGNHSRHVTLDIEELDSGEDSTWTDWLVNHYLGLDTNFIKYVLCRVKQGPV